MQSFNYTDPALTNQPPADDIKFWRLFGDENGNGYIDASDTADFTAALLSLSNQPNYRRCFDFNNDGSISTSLDKVQFDIRKNRNFSVGTSMAAF